MHSDLWLVLRVLHAQEVHYPGGAHNHVEPADGVHRVEHTCAADTFATVAAAVVVAVVDDGGAADVDFVVAVAAAAAFVARLLPLQLVWPLAELGQVQVLAAAKVGEQVLGPKAEQLFCFFAVEPLLHQL